MIYKFWSCSVSRAVDLTCGYTLVSSRETLVPKPGESNMQSKLRITDLKLCYLVCFVDQQYRHPGSWREMQTYWIRTRMLTAPHPQVVFMHVKIWEGTSVFCRRSEPVKFGCSTACAVQPNCNTRWRCRKIKFVPERLCELKRSYLGERLWMHFTKVNSKQ